MTDQRIELYKQALEKNISGLFLASQSYDKAILSLSTASLGFSFAFIKLIHCFHHNCVLLFTWFFFILAILFVLVSFLIDQSHTAHKIKFLYWRILSEGEKVEETHWTDHWMLPPTILAGIFFILGMVLFTIFVGINI